VRAFGLYLRDAVRDCRLACLETVVQRLELRQQAFGDAQRLQPGLQLGARSEVAVLCDPRKELAKEMAAAFAIPETSDEVSQIDEALSALRTGLSRTTRELGGSREELRLTKERLDDQERLVLTDGLTGVWNRRYLEMALSDALQRGQRRKRPFAVLMVDLDRTERVYDELAHAHREHLPERLLPA